MTGLFDEARRLRDDDAAQRDDWTRAEGPPPEGAAVLVATTTTVGTYPTTAAAYYACTPAVVFGAETEGAAGTVTAAAGVFYALNLGSVIPNPGTQVLTTFVGHRWVFRYDGP